MVAQTTVIAAEVTGSGWLVELCMYVLYFKLLLWKISNAYKSRETNLMNSHAPTRYPVNLSRVFVCQALSTAV